MAYKKGQEIHFNVGLIASVNPASTTFYYMGLHGGLSTSEGVGAVKMPCDGVIIRAYLGFYCENNTSADDWEWHINKNGSPVDAIATVGNTSKLKYFINNNLNVPVKKDDLIELSTITPPWDTPPTGLRSNACMFWLKIS